MNLVAKPALRKTLRYPYGLKKETDAKDPHNLIRGYLGKQ